MSLLSKLLAFRVPPDAVALTHQIQRVEESPRVYKTRQPLSHTKVIIGALGSQRETSRALDTLSCKEFGKRCMF